MISLLLPALALAGTPTQVSRVYTYACEATFFEGEGASPNQITCEPGQHLGVITATRTYYVFHGDHDTSFPEGDQQFPADICRRNSFLKEKCAVGSPKLAFGLSTTKTADYSVEVMLPTGPGGQTVLMGYGAEPKKHGDCPAGLVKANAYVAKLKHGSGKPLPNSLPADGVMDAVRLETRQPENYVVMRQQNETPCDATGDCSRASFADPTQMISVPYKRDKAMSVCVVPASQIVRGEDKHADDGAGAEPAN